ncbi:MAG: SUMF1/EgtB/PvdO family nonheme iron enzyme [Chloroflexota bacterium]
MYQTETSAKKIRNIIGEPFEWCEVPAGEFLFGTMQTRLTIPDFAIAKYPTTYSQYQVFVDAPDGLGNARWWEGFSQDESDLRDQEWKIDNHPRERVNWYDALGFCRWLSWKLGGGYEIEDVNSWLIRLPSEFEWEKAARGTDGRIYPYGNEFDETRSNTFESGVAKTTDVMTYSQGVSPYGVFDMSGNLWEWCFSSLNNPRLDPMNEEIKSDVIRCLRGGSFSLKRTESRVDSRYGNRPSVARSSFGFRIMRPL